MESGQWLQRLKLEKIHMFALSVVKNLAIEENLFKWFSSVVDS